MTLSQIIEASASRMKDVSVTMVTNYGTVTITDLTGVQDDIFLQGDDAILFLSQVEHLWRTTRNLSKSTIALHLAESYTENLWN